MVGRDVQCLEVVVLGLDLRAGRDVEPHALEDGLDLALNLSQRVQVSDGAADSGHRHIDALAQQPRVEGSRLDAAGAFLERVRDAVAQLVQQPAGLALVLGRDVAESLEQLRHAALASQVLDAEGLERRGVADAGEAARHLVVQVANRRRERIQVAHGTASIAVASAIDKWVSACSLRMQATGSPKRPASGRDDRDEN